VRQRRNKGYLINEKRTLQINLKPLLMISTITVSRSVTNRTKTPHQPWVGQATKFTVNVVEPPFESRGGPGKGLIAFSNGLCSAHAADDDAGDGSQADDELAVESQHDAGAFG
jgi:hypothetical protein